MFTIGIDVGGTYTDLVAIDEAGRAVFAKSPSTPADQSIGVMAGLEELARRLKLSRGELLAATERLVHGTTVATNALLERKGAKVALLTTEGHRDVIEMREGLKPNRYDLRSPPPEPLVPRELRLGVRERLKANGDVLDSARRPSRSDDAYCAPSGNPVRPRSPSAFCIPTSIPCHEIAAVQRLARELPDVSLSRSSDVLPQIKEYERVSTTIVNAYVGPVVRHYLTNLEQRLVEAGFKGSLFIILSHGGMAPVEEASRLAAGTVLSGPAGGVSGGRRCADLLGIPDLVPFDMGGTSTDISLISERPGIAFRRRHAGRTTHRAAQPRHCEHRGRRRIDRQRRCRRNASCRTGKRGLRAGSGLLWQWRLGCDRYRRQRRSRLSRRRRLHGRKASARPCRSGSRGRPDRSFARAVADRSCRRHPPDDQSEDG